MYSGRTWTSLREVEKFDTPHLVLTGPIVSYENAKVMETASTPITNSLILDINNFEVAHFGMYFGEKIEKFKRLQKIQHSPPRENQADSFLRDSYVNEKVTEKASRPITSSRILNINNLKVAHLGPLRPDGL